MIANLPRRRSLVLWALLAVAMVAVSYLMILLLAAMCVYLPYLAITSLDSPGIQIIALFLGGIAMAGAMVWSLVPKQDKFEAPGPTLDPSQHPKLFAEIKTIANALNEPLPAEVYLIPQVNAFVADRGGTMGFGARRVMGIGLPLLAIMTVSEFRAVLAHEFAHYYGGDTRLGPWVYKTRLAMVRTIQNMASIGRWMRVAIAQILYRIVMWLLQGYWKLFFLATQLISRRQEYRADELACHIAGSQSLVSGLSKIEGGTAAFPAYWNLEVLPYLNLGYRPGIAEGFALFVEAPQVARQVEENVKKELAQPHKSAYDSHPPLRKRIAAAQRFRGSSQEIASSAPAVCLLDDLLSEEARILSWKNSPSEIAALKVVAWNDLSSVLPQIWREFVKNNAQFLGDVTADSLPDVIAKLPEITSRIPDPKGMLLTREQRTARTAEFFWIALALAIVEAGWPLHLQPGEHYVQVDNERVGAKELMQQLLSKQTTREAWIERCRSLKIVGVRLAGPKEAAAGK